MRTRCVFAAAALTAGFSSDSRAAMLLTKLLTLSSPVWTEPSRTKQRPWNCTIHGQVLASLSNSDKLEKSLAMQRSALIKDWYTISYEHLAVCCTGEI